ncbi:hypothetical protein lerEdw1_017499 [Lerista edwardsae]|nr:hypothetical protein lerEdw1_017499 [Lerista edwardsae]
MAEVVEFCVPTGNETTLLVLGLETDASEHALYEAFSAFGLLYSVRICRNAPVARPGYHALVKFYSARDARRAQGALNQQCLFQKSPLKVCVYTRRKRFPQQVLALNSYKCQELANHYLGFNGWSSHIITLQNVSGFEEEEMRTSSSCQQLKYLCIQELTIPQHRIRTRGVSVAEPNVDTNQEFLMATYRAQKLAAQQALSDAFQKILLVVLENGKIAVEFSSTQEDLVDCLTEEELRGLIQVTDLTLSQLSPKGEEEILDFTGNAISSIGKQAWKAYPWTEHLVLKGNGLSQVQNTSLEGLLMLTHLDLSCNKIQVIQRKAFEVVPFLRFINFSGNILDRISHGAFEAWHGMQFLLKLDLTHNPLAVIEDDYFYGLPSLKILDLGATEITAKVLMNILRTSLQLKSLFLPKKMSCCLCRMKKDIEILRDTVKLDCANECNGRTNLCAEKEDPLNKMQKEIMKVLEIRKMNASRTLTIMPEKLSQNTKLNHTGNNVDNPNIADLPPTPFEISQGVKQSESRRFSANQVD